MSLREDRMAGRIRRFLLVPTEDVTADGLTKNMVSPPQMDFRTHGVLVIKMRLNKQILCRVRTKQLSYAERDLDEMRG